MNEDQIVRYGRQILLRELGGRGQERLLASPVRVLGSGPGIDDAVAFLLAGGTPIELAGGVTLGGFLTGVVIDAPSKPAVAQLVPHGLKSSATDQVVVGEGVAFRTAAACPKCWETTLESLKSGRGDGPVGSLAALTLQRVVLGWAAPCGIVHWRSDRFEAAAIAGCGHR